MKLKTKLPGLELLEIQAQMHLQKVNTLLGLPSKFFSMSLFRFWETCFFLTSISMDAYIESIDYSSDEEVVEPSLRIGEEDDDWMDNSNQSDSFGRRKAPSGTACDRLENWSTRRIQLLLGTNDGKKDVLRIVHLETHGRGNLVLN